MSNLANNECTAVITQVEGVSEMRPPVLNMVESLPGISTPILTNVENIIKCENKNV